MRYLIISIAVVAGAVSLHAAGEPGILSIILVIILPTRFELTKGSDLVVDPEPESGPIKFLAYPLLEMNGEVVKPETTFTFRRIGA
jgi:hypothetical protein